MSDTVSGFLISGLIICYVLTQSIYFVNNIFVDVLIFNRESKTIDESSPPEPLPTLHVLIPLYEERRSVVERTIEGITTIDYPKALLKVYCITEEDDHIVDGYLTDLIAEYQSREVNLFELTVDRGIVATYALEGHWDLTGEGIPRTKASAIKYAFRTLGLPPDDVVTVFDADTIVPEDLFKLAVTGLETYDVVQAKQTVRNHSDGWLPRLEAMGMAGWCHSIYAKTWKGPYQLLGKAYFFRVRELWDIGDWQVDAITEDITLGIDAYSNGYSLGVIDRYVQDICPVQFSPWIQQKRRWVAGPYPYLRFEDFRPIELIRFWAHSAANQIISLVNVVGVPAGILYFVLGLTGVNLYQSLPLIAITSFNLINWTFYTILTYQASMAGVRFTSYGDAVKFFLASNPFTQLLYSILWAIPIALSSYEFIRGGRRPSEFHVTPKEVKEIESELPARSPGDPPEKAQETTPVTSEFTND